MRGLLPALLCLSFVAATAAVADPGAAFIHGTVVLHDGEEHTGFLRWRDEEAFWDDLFQSNQRDLPWFDQIDTEALHKERERRYFAEHGLFDRLIWSLNNSKDDLHPRRLFICRYGDLSGLILDAGEDRDDIVAVMRDGRRVPIGGYSNDVSSDIQVHGAGAEMLEFEWDDLREIRFSAAPTGAEPYTTRLHGVVRHRHGEYRGPIQWDVSECTYDDIIDSDSEDLPLGRFRHIARDPRGGSRAKLDDGTELHLNGSNDVGRGHRGVMVEVPALGRVVVAWDQFESADLECVPPAGPDYAAFADPVPLRGTVIGTDGQRRYGRLVYDLDEAWSNDIFNGEGPEGSFYIPFANIQTITPGPDAICRITLRDGRTLELGDAQDTGDDHAGLLVVPDDGGEPTHVLWRLVERVEFAP